MLERIPWFSYKLIGAQLRCWMFIPMDSLPAVCFHPEIHVVSEMIIVFMRMSQVVSHHDAFQLMLVDQE
jgi:hypothetical protein